MAVSIAILIVCCALPGLWSRRGGPWPARFAVIVAFAAIGLAVLDLSFEVLTATPPRVVVLPTTALDPARSAALAARFPGVDVEVDAGTDRLSHRLARSRLRYPQDPALVLMWTGRFNTAGASGAGHRAVVLTDQKTVLLDPEDVEVRLLRAPEAGRPGGLEVWLHGDRVPGLRGRLRVVDAADRTTLERTFGDDPVTIIDWVPEQGGRHEVHLLLTAAGVEYRGVGVVAVAASSVVTVVGAQAMELAKILAVQGINVRQAGELPAELTTPKIGTLVVLDPLDTAAQERVRRFVEDGGGLFMVGGEGGGGVPSQAEPLAELSPVLLLPLPKTGRRDGDGPPAGKSEQSDDPAAGRTDPDAAASRPPKPPLKQDDAATGDTSGARLTDEEREVRRRVIAMVLLVDRSGSMGLPVADGVSCMAAAKSSALRSALALDEQDLLGIVSFGNKDSARVVLPMTSVRQAKRIKSALDSLRTMREYTFVRDGLDRARSLLDRVQASIKCVVVITDGVFADVKDIKTKLAARAYQDSKISLQIVQLLSPNSDPEPDSATSLESLAKLGRGRVIAQESVTRVPTLVITEVRRLRTQVGRSERRDHSDQPEPPNQQPDPKTPQENPVPPKQQPDPKKPRLRVRIIEDSVLLEPQPADEFPPVGGVLPVRGRPGTRILLAAGADGIPLLAFANRGLGKVAAWSADFLGPWGRSWIADPSFPGRLALWVQSLAPAVEQPAQGQVLHRPEVSPELPLPREAAYLEALAGVPMRPVDTFVPPSPGVRTEVRGRAVAHAWYGVLLLLLLAGIEFFSARRPWRRG